MLVAIDDLQWLDRSSSRVLDFVLRRFEARRSTNIRFSVGYALDERLQVNELRR